ncbi:putative E3 ubiquitin-protein ligase HERC4 [Porphyrio hochstetteri]
MRLVKELGSEDIVQIACGDHHAMALSRGGKLFTWGQNTHGQLGVGSQSPLAPQARLVEGLRGIPLARIAAGGAHSTAVSLSGAVYSWGRNHFGQLGLGDTEARDCPSYVGALEHWKAVLVSCGADHTAVLSKEGLVCTFGAGGAGQLGHNSTQRELRPRVVAELWGARVSQVACGRQHTLAYVPSLETVYLFGSAEGQLGDKRKASHLIPLPMDLPEKPAKPRWGKPPNVVEIMAQGDQSIVLWKKKQSSYPTGTATVPRGDVGVWSSNSPHWESIKKDIRLIFSSEACINGSFLEQRDKHFKTSREALGVDMSEVQRFFEAICQRPKVFEEVQRAIENLSPSLSSSLNSPEKFRVYVVLPFLLQGGDESSHRSLRLLARAVMRLKPEDLQTLECLWSNLETPYFQILVILYQEVAQSVFDEVISDWQRNPCNPQCPETVTLEVLQLLYQVNARTGFRVQQNDFYVPKGGLEFIHFFTQWEPCKYPCIFNLIEKIRLHRMEVCQIVSSTFNSEGSELCWRFLVRRESLLEDIWAHLNYAQSQHFLMPLEVVFLGEPAQDQGGPCQELFNVAARTLSQPGTGPFHRVASGFAWFPTQAADSGDMFLQAGTLCGMALYNGRTVPLRFPATLYKKLLGLQPTMKDLEELWPGEARSLQEILDKECDHYFESQELDFTIMKQGDSMVVVELKEGGANIPVTKENRSEYVDLYLNYLLSESVREPFEDFMQGFLRGCPSKQWKIFLPEELQVVLQGQNKYDWHLLEKNTRYWYYTKLDRTIRDFWAVFHKLTEKKKKNFLAFVSGTDLIPGCGLEYFQFQIVDPQVNNPDEVYPSANTCNHSLNLPRYSSQTVLKEKLRCAIKHKEGFGLL